MDLLGQTAMLAIGRTSYDKHMWLLVQGKFEDAQLECENGGFGDKEVLNL